MGDWIRAAAAAVFLAFASPFPAVAAEPWDAIHVVDAFHEALQRGNAKAAVALFDKNAVVLEQGGVERSLAEYASQHLQADMDFAAAVRHVLLWRKADRVGDFAWVMTRGRATGRFRDRDIDSYTTETMLLSREGPIWHIIHVHWSSSPVPRD